MEQPILCSQSGSGQTAFNEAMVEVFGFREVSAGQLPQVLQEGHRVLVNHGWPESLKLADRHPGQITVIWHTNWAGVDDLGIGSVLEEVLVRLRQGVVGLLWLDKNDLLPMGARHLTPVWSPKKLRELVRGTPAKDEGHVVAGLHGMYPTAAKNVVVAVLGSVAAGATVHVGKQSFVGKRGEGLKAALWGYNYIEHEVLSRKAAVGLIAGCELLVHPSVSEVWPYMTLEAAYNGTPVVGSDAIAWMEGSVVQGIVRPATSVVAVRNAVRNLFGSKGAVEYLLNYQRETLDRLLPRAIDSAWEDLRQAGFMPGQKTIVEVRKREEPKVAVQEVRPLPKLEDMERVVGVRMDEQCRPRVILCPDVPGWAFDVNLRDMAEYLGDRFAFEFWYVAEESKWPRWLLDEDGLAYLPYHLWAEFRQDRLAWERTVGSLRSWWFRAKEPGPPTEKDIELANRFAAFHVVTAFNYKELEGKVRNLRYLTNPVNMKRFPKPTDVYGEIIAEWNGNANHMSAGPNKDVKGYSSIVIPACEAANVKLASLEYGTNRILPSEMPAFYRKANVALMASLFEGASNSCMEAMASGLAVVCTDVGNHREMQESQVEHFGDTGIMIVDRTPEAFVKALKKLKRSKKRVKEMGELNRKEIQERWSWDVWADKYAEFLWSGI